MFVPRIGAVWYPRTEYIDVKAAPLGQSRAALVRTVFGTPAQPRII
jgi:hypothetical protein